MIPSLRLDTHHLVEYSGDGGNRKVSHRTPLAHCRLGFPAGGLREYPVATKFSHRQTKIRPPSCVCSGIGLRSPSFVAHNQQYRDRNTNESCDGVGRDGAVRLALDLDAPTDSSHLAVFWLPVHHFP